jgi:LysR family transcriptional activator of glutamate synthase operon
MRISELRWFLAAVDDPNLTRLSGSLHVSQSALSRSLRRLEQTVGVDLFDRVGRSLAPNYQGRMLALGIARAIEEIDARVQDVRESADPEHGVIRLAFLHTLGIWLVPGLIGAYRAQHPHVRFELRESVEGVALAGLVDGRHDLLLTSPRPTDPLVHWMDLLIEPLVLAVPPGHRLAARRRIHLNEVADDPFITTSDETGLRIIVDQLFHRAGFSPQVAFEGNDVETLRGLVSAGLGVALLPARPGAPASPPLLGVSDFGAERSIGLAWHRDRYRSPAVAAFADFIATTRNQLQHWAASDVTSPFSP